MKAQNGPIVMDHAIISQPVIWFMRQGSPKD